MNFKVAYLHFHTEILFFSALDEHLIANPVNMKLFYFMQEKLDCTWFNFFFLVQVWQNYTCMVSESGLCNTTGRITPDRFTQLVAAINESYALEHYTPPLLCLQNCDFVRDTFQNITSNYCHPLERYLKMVNAGLGLISVGVLLCLFLWIFYANRPEGRKCL